VTSDAEEHEYGVIQEIKRLKFLKEQKAEAEREIADIELYLSKNMEGDYKEVPIEDGKVIKAVVVRQMMDRFETNILERDPKVWAAVTEPVFSKTRYMDALRRGIEDPKAPGVVTREMHNDTYHQVPKRAYVTTKTYTVKETHDA
jgi:hypothetical protein